MAQAVPDVRPEVISPETAAALDEFRKFRHLVRNVYTAHLDPKKMRGLLIALPSLWERLKVELAAFADFVDQLSRADESA